ncbi:MAG TPA: hypothetical protein VLJ59_02475 [Mycobacteriales bacterium]|nr:hypothetical protein [Mycobacteriales bacterium]
MRGVLLVRWVLLAVGVALAGFGVWTLLHRTFDTRPVDTATWAVGGLVLHDGLLAPVVFLAGWLLARAVPARVVPAWARAMLGSVLVLAGVCVLLLVPKWRSPAHAGNPSVHPPPSAADIAVAVAVALATLGLAQLAAWWLNARVRRSSVPTGASDR